jgi:hypothetical protein
MFRRKHPQAAPHAQNSVVERPQNRHLKPFKSRAENNGQLDPRINVGGRPKILFEESAAYLREIDPDTGKTNARVMIETTAKLAKRINPMAPACTYGALKTLRDIAEPTEEATGQAITDKAFIRELCELLIERQVNAIET